MPTLKELYLKKLIELNEKKIYNTTMPDYIKITIEWLTQKRQELNFDPDKDQDDNKKYWTYFAFSELLEELTSYGKTGNQEKQE